MKYIKQFEEFDFSVGDNNEDDFIASQDFLEKSEWKKYVPETITVDKNGEEAIYEIGDIVKNLNRINLDYSLKEADSETIANKLKVTISFKMDNDDTHPMDDNKFQSIIEVTMGTLYIMGLKISSKGERKFMDGEATIDSESKECLLKLSSYVSGKNI